MKKLELAAFSRTILIFINAVLIIMFQPAYASDTNWGEFFDKMEKASAFNKSLLSQVEQQFRCQNNNAFYGIQAEENLHLFVARCSGKGIVGIQQANQQWTFKDCGMTSFSQPPAMPNVPPQYLPEAFLERKQWISQDYCNVWKVMPLSLGLQREIAQLTQDDEKIKAKITQETGCHFVDFLFRSSGSSLIHGQKRTEQSELMRVRCPSNIYKVVYQNQNDPHAPLQIHICHSKNEKVCFKDRHGLDFCSSIACGVDPTGLGYPNK
jgi:hypothetical protein